VYVVKPSNQEIITVLLKRYGSTFAEELDIPVKKNTPSALFRLLCASLLFSARISYKIAIKAAKALTEHGWTTPEKMVAAEWAERTKALNRAGYARYDESTSRMLGDTAQMLLDRYKGDLRNLREEADREPDNERTLLKQFKGIGDVGVDIFFREVQVIWEELFPFADQKTLKGAKNLGFTDDVRALADLTGSHDFPRFVAALVRVQLEDKYTEVLEEAQQLKKK
jgi:endonuclease III